MAIGSFRAREIEASFATTNSITTGETTLGTTSLQAQGFSGIGSMVHVLAFGTVANNANAKTLTFYFGTASQAFTLPASAAASWVLDAWVFSAGSASQRVTAAVTSGAAALPPTAETYVSSPTQNDLANITVKVTGTATSTNDIVCNGFVVLV